MNTVKHIEIKDQSVYADGNRLFSFPEEESFTAFAKALYKRKEIDYPKFYKMSNMCKLGFLAAELLLEGSGVSRMEPTRTALVLACRAASLQADVEYQKSISAIPSPALFVYTLANIVTGEICIRHGIKGEEMMLVQEQFDRDGLMGYVEILTREGNTDVCVAGFVDFDEKDKYWASLYLLRK
ncbi:MAG: hypothetical protein QM786_11665 [Breznakibacter sp.]